VYLLVEVSAFGGMDERRYPVARFHEQVPKISCEVASVVTRAGRGRPRTALVGPLGEKHVVELSQRWLGTRSLPEVLPQEARECVNEIVNRHRPIE
jgi:hypothetical protein